MLALEQLRVAGLQDPHLLQHLAHDHADVLVVDLHTLQSVHLLNLVQQVLLHRPRALDPQNVVRVHRTLGETVARPHPVALVHAKVLARRHLVELRRLRVVHHRRPVVQDPQRLHEDLPLAALDVAEAHHAVDLRDRGRILRATRLEELRHARQTARDVSRLVRLAADLGQHRAGAHLLAVLDDELSADRDHEVANSLLLPALLLHDLDVRVQALLAVLDDHALTETGELVELLGHRLVLDDVHEAYRALHVRYDRRGVRVPCEHHGVALHLAPVLHHQERAERHLEAREHGRVLVLRRADDDLSLVRGDDLLSLGIGHVDQPLTELDHAAHLRLARRLLGDACRRAADVEGTERELRTRLADRLRRQNSHRLAQIHHLHGGQVAAVAHPAESTLRLAGEHRANPHGLDSRVLDRARSLLVDQFPGLHQQKAATRFVDLVRILHVLGGHRTHDALAERLDHILAFLQRADLETENGAAILFRDRHVLRHVHQTTREVAGVGRLERRVGQTLSRAVRRDEVLEHRQPFAEVRLDRAFDDLADAAGELLLRLRHQAAHSGELPDLIARTTRA